MMKNKIKSFFERSIHDYPILYIFVGLCLVASIIAPGFLSFRNFVNIFTQQAYIGVACVGVTFLMIGGNRDLSIGMVVGLSACLTAGLMPKIGWMSLVVALCAGLLAGLVNGFFVGKVGLHSFIVTLATMQGVRSATYIYTKEMSMVGISESFAKFSDAEPLGIPFAVWILIISVVIAELVLKFTKHGRNTYAVGGNKEAAYNAGINVTLTVIINFMIASFTGAIGGIINVMRIRSGIPELGFPNLHFLILVMVVLGGTKLSGGVGRAIFTLGGIMTLGVIENILNFMNVHVYFVTLIVGLLMLGVLVLDKIMTDLAIKRQEAGSHLDTA